MINIPPFTLYYKPTDSAYETCVLEFANDIHL